MKTAQQVSQFFQLSDQVIIRRAKKLGIPKRKGYYLFNFDEIDKILGRAPKVPKPEIIRIVEEYWIVHSKMNYESN